MDKLAHMGHVKHGGVGLNSLPVQGEILMGLLTGQ